MFSNVRLKISLRFKKLGVSWWSGSEMSAADAAIVYFSAIIPRKVLFENFSKYFLSDIELK